MLFIDISSFFWQWMGWPDQDCGSSTSRQRTDSMPVRPTLACSYWKDALAQFPANGTVIDLIFCRYGKTVPR
jgi:hypothetical protein